MGKGPSGEMAFPRGVEPLDHHQTTRGFHPNSPVGGAAQGTPRNVNTSNSANPRTAPFLVATIGVLSEPPVASATLLSTQMLAAERISASAAKPRRAAVSVRLSPKEPPCFSTCPESIQAR